MPPVMITIPPFQVNVPYAGWNQVPAPTGVAATDTGNVNATLALGGVTVFQPGLYRLSGISLPPGAVLKGVSSGGLGIENPDTQQTHLSLDAGVNTHLLHLPAGAANVVIEDVFLDGNKNNNTSGDVIHADDVTAGEQLNLHLNRVHVEAAAGYGAYIGHGRRSSSVYQSQFLYSGSSGMHLLGSDHALSMCQFANSGNNIDIGASVTRLTDCDLWGAGLAAVNVMNGSNGIVIKGNGIDRNQNQGIVVGTGCFSVSILGNILHTNSQSANDAYAHIEVKNAAGTVIDGNVTTLDSGYPNVASYLIYQDAGCAAQIGACNYAYPGTANHGLHN